ncbi:MAG: carboxypeptidase-like regulatory domain-containing protein, partial [Saprospiraceae bacterium]|nr:carboxypeptidase-like regulatory domain-containing protein [Saprospiraceae bacterium]
MKIKRILLRSTIVVFQASLILLAGSASASLGNLYYHDFPELKTLAPIVVTGRVTDEDGLALPGAAVFEKGTSNGTVTDVDGNFSLTVDEGATLVISFLGYADQEVLVLSQTSIAIQMRESASALDEVVVTGYGRQVKRDITGSVATLSARQIQDIPVTSFENAIHGQMAGVQVSETSGEPGAGPSIRIRGIGSISAGNEPLYVIDGFPLSKNVDLGIQGDNFRRGEG